MTFVPASFAVISALNVKPSNALNDQGEMAVLFPV